MTDESDLERVLAYLSGAPAQDLPALQQALKRLLQDPAALPLDADPHLLEALAALDDGLVWPEIAALEQNRAVLTSLDSQIMQRLDALRADPGDPDLDLMPYPPLSLPVQAEPPPVRGWVEVIGGAFQRLPGEIRVRLPRLLPPAMPAYALAGVKGQSGSPGRASTGSELARIHLDPEQTGGAEVEAFLQGDANQQPPFRLTVRAVVAERWPDLAGIVVRATGDGWSAAGLTDADGMYIFSAVPAAAIDTLEIAVFVPLS